MRLNRAEEQLGAEAPSYAKGECLRILGYVDQFFLCVLRGRGWGRVEGAGREGGGEGGGVLDIHPWP